MLSRFRTTRDDDGFTLIELLVVIIIIGILAAIAIPVFLNQRKKATEASIKSDLKTIATAVETYYVDNQSYPDQLTASSGTITIGTTSVPLSKNNFAQVSTIASGVNGGYCIRAWNSTIGDYNTAIYYNSVKGGIQPDGSTCGV